MARGLALATTLVCSLSSPAGLAEPATSKPEIPNEVETSPRVILVLSNDSTLAERVHGQTVELEARITSRPETPEGTWNQQVERARAAARSEPASLVVWVVDMNAAPGEAQHSEARAFVAILLSDTDRLYTRAIGPAFDTSTEEDVSAVLELAALSVRAALESLDSTDALGVPLSQLPAAEDPTGSALQAAPHGHVEKPEGPSGDRAPLQASSQLPPAVRWTEPTGEVMPPSTDPSGISATAVLALGVGTHIDGVTPFAWPALQIRGGLGWASLRTLVVGELGSDRRAETAEADVVLERHLLAAQAELALSSTSRALVPWVTGSAGVVLLRRSTEPRSTTVVATPTNALWSPLFRVGLGLEYELSGGAPSQHLALNTGVDVVARPPMIEFVTTEEATVRRFRVHVWQPHANLSWVAVW